MSQTVWQR